MGVAMIPGALSRSRSRRRCPGHLDRVASTPMNHPFAVGDRILYRNRPAIVLGFVEGCIEIRLLPTARDHEGELALVEPQNLMGRD